MGSSDNKEVGAHEGEENRRKERRRHKFGEVREGCWKGGGGGGGPTGKDWLERGENWSGRLLQETMTGNRPQQTDSSGRGGGGGGETSLFDWASGMRRGPP